jgi:peptide-methionine (S)-S-oxide reductase
MTSTLRTEGKHLEIPPIDLKAPSQTETATLALGCFWGPDAQFGVTPGVVRTQVGYAGGRQPHPTYYDLGDHIETVQIEFDPKVTSYQQLLDIFWRSHNPHKPGWLRQYMSAIFYHSNAQENLARETLEREFKRTNREICTEIMPYTKFNMAEGYHQKYHLRQYRDLVKEYIKIYPDENDFIHSTSAARVNGYVAGYGNLTNLYEEIESLGLSDKGNEVLREIVLRFSKQD